MAYLTKRPVWMLGISLTLLIAGTCAHADVPVGAMTWDPAVFLVPKTHDAPGFKAGERRRAFAEAVASTAEPDEPEAIPTMDARLSREENDNDSDSHYHDGSSKEADAA